METKSTAQLNFETTLKSLHEDSIIKAKSFERGFEHHLKQNANLITEDEYQQGLKIYRLFNSNLFLGSASKNKNITDQVFQNLKGILKNELSLEAFKTNIERLKKQDREEMKSSSLAIGMGIFALIFGISALALYFFNPTELVYPYGWMIIYEIAAGVVSLLLAGLSIFIGIITYDYNDNYIKNCWEGYTNQKYGIQTIVNQLTPEDISLLEKLNSEAWKTKFDSADQELEAFRKKMEEETQPFGSPIANPIEPKETAPKNPNMTASPNPLL